MVWNAVVSGSPLYFKLAEFTLAYRFPCPCRAGHQALALNFYFLNRRFGFNGVLDCFLRFKGAVCPD